MQKTSLLIKLFLVSVFVFCLAGQTTASAQENFSLLKLFASKQADTERYTLNLDADLQSFATLAAKMQMLCEGALKPGSYLDRISNPAQLSNQQQLRQAYRFWKLFNSFQQNLDRIAEKYEVPLVFNHSNKVERYFTGYVLGISARFCRLMCVSDLMNFLNTRPKLAELFNEKNAEFDYQAKSLDQAVRNSLKPESLAHLYRFRISHFEELQNLLNTETKALARMPANYLLANHSILDELSHKVANDPTWKFLSLSVINYSLDFILPAQRSIFTWVGDTRIKQQKTRLISRSQRHKFGEMLEPGDIVLGRQDWYLSNIFLPGFWPHAMLYVGTDREMKKKFDNDPEVQRWCEREGVKNFADLLRQDFPIAFKNWQKSGLKEIGPKVIIEATSDGVIFANLDHSCHCDYLSALRPNLTPFSVAKAIHTAFFFFGREYDFQFSFNSEQTLVCTELVTKSYAGNGGKGLKFPLIERYGKSGVSADTMVETYVKEFGTTTPQLDFVAFLKGMPASGKAIFASREEFAGSYKWRGGLQSPQTLK